MKKEIKIALIEDDENLRFLIAHRLINEGFIITQTGNGDLAEELIITQQPDIVLLDWMLPGKDGAKICSSLRQKGFENIVIMMTAKAQDLDKIDAYNFGVSDYITKPFDPEVLILRINNILKRAYSSTNDEFKVSDTVLKYNTLELISGNTKEKLTLKEAQLLKYFIINKNKILAREDILTEIWGEDDYFLGRSMDVFISRLRKYVSEDKNIDIRTVRGTGFILEEINK